MIDGQRVHSECEEVRKLSFLLICLFQFIR